ncbi:MAG: alanine dehydrogenase, partial [Patescibacteria group bacterium]
MRQCMVGVPKEVKPQEGRVGITPDGVRALRSLDIEVGIETEAGELSGFSDDDYISAGALCYLKLEALYKDADIIVKVKEPTPSEYHLLPLLRGKTLFTFLHLAGVDPELTKLLLEHKVTAIAYETVTGTANGRTIFPILVPMS